MVSLELTPSFRAGRHLCLATLCSGEWLACFSDNKCDGVIVTMDRWPTITQQRKQGGGTLTIENRKIRASSLRTIATVAVATMAASLLACIPLDAFSATRCVKPAEAEARVIRRSFERTLLADFEGEPSAGPLFEPCIVRPKDFGRYVLLDFSAEGFYGGNNWGQFWALGRFDKNKQLVWLAGGTSGGNPPPPYRVGEVRQGDEAWVIWHDAQCASLSFRGLVVPTGANMAFPDARWKKVTIEYSRCGSCEGQVAASCVRTTKPGAQPVGERIR